MKMTIEQKEALFREVWEMLADMGAVGSIDGSEFKRTRQFWEDNGRNFREMGATIELAKQVILLSNALKIG